MQLKEEYTIEDTKNEKTNTLIYSYSLNGKLDLWNNKYLGLKNIIMVKNQKKKHLKTN